MTKGAVLYTTTSLSTSKVRSSNKGKVLCFIFFPIRDDHHTTTPPPPPPKPSASVVALHRGRSRSTCTCTPHPSTAWRSRCCVPRAAVQHRGGRREDLPSFKEEQTELSQSGRNLKDQIFTDCRLCAQRDVWKSLKETSYHAGWVGTFVCLASSDLETDPFGDLWADMTQISTIRRRSNQHNLE